jgi:TadE-like protein
MQRVRGQSMVEMAFLLPLLLSLIFAIIDMGWYIYGFATLTQAARNGAEVAAQLPPYPETVDDYVAQGSDWSNDECIATIRTEVQRGAVMFDLLNPVTVIQVIYPNKADGTPYTPQRERGNPIQVDVSYDLEPLTPLFQWLPIGNEGRFSITASSIRSIESLGNTPPSDEHPSGVACLQVP